MKFKKQYHTLQGDKTWKPTFSETVEMDPAEADRQNKNFSFSGVKYTPVVDQADTDESDKDQASKEIASMKSFDDAVDATLHNQAGEATDGKTEVPGPAPADDLAQSFIPDVKAAVDNGDYDLQKSKPAPAAGC